MVALRGKEVDSYLARPDAGRPIILLYGPDAGLVRERADALLASAVDDPNDPFSLVKLDGDELSAEPSRLVDEAMTVPLFGGRRAIRVRAGSRSFAGGIETLAEVTLDDVMAVVADASELKLDPIVDGAFAGRPDIVETEFAKAMIAGTYPGVIISAAQRQAAWLHKSALAIAEGTPLSTLLDGGFPRLHFSRKGAVEIALRNLSAPRLATIIDQLGTA